MKRSIKWGIYTSQILAYFELGKMIKKSQLQAQTKIPISTLNKILAFLVKEKRLTKSIVVKACPSNTSKKKYDFVRIVYYSKQVNS